MPLPSLKDVGTLVKKGIEMLPSGALLREFLPKPKGEPMRFEVGEGLSPEQQNLAQEKIKQLATTGKTFPSSLDKPMETEDAWRINLALLEKKRRGVTLTPYDLAAGEEAGKTLEDAMTSAVFGFFTPQKKVAEKVVKEVIEPTIKRVAGKVAPKELKPLAQEARKYKTMEEFVKAFQGEIKHGEYWHITDDPNFKISPKLGPRDLSSLARGEMDKGKLMVTSDIEYWNAEFPNRKFAAKLDFSAVKPEDYYQVNRCFGKEFFVKDPSKVRVEKVIPIEQAIKEHQQFQKVLEKNITSKSQLTDFYNQATKGIKEIKPEVKPPIPPKPPVKPIPKALPADLEPLSQIENPVQKIITALKEAKPIRGTQETIYTKERAKRLAEAISIGEKVEGEAGFIAEKAALKGEFPKVQFESIRKALNQEDVDFLFRKVKENPLLTDWEKVTAREGLLKMLGEFGGKVPTENELVLLDNVFGKEFTDTILSRRPFIDKLKEAGLQIANIPRSFMSSSDLSFGGRQGVFVAPSFRKEFFKSWVKQFQTFGSEKAYKLAQEDLIKNPHYILAKESGVSFTDIGRIMSQREEKFMSQWAEKIPIVGIPIRASSRAYTGFANKLRMDIFSSMVKQAETLGLNPSQNRDLTKSIAQFVNTATGRGSLGALERSAVVLNAFFFSPRLMASRLSLLNPQYYLSQPSFVRKQAIKSLFAFVGTGMTILGLAKLAGADVGTDPRSADFGKIKIGNTRLDIWGGFQQYARMAGQLLSGTYVSSITGKEITLGEGYKPLTRYDIIFRQIEAKEAPIFSFITDLLRGQTFMGKPISEDIERRFLPMAINDLIEVANDDPSLLPIGALGIFGVGIQTYEPIITPSKIKGFPSLERPATQLPSLKGLGQFPK